MKCTGAGAGTYAGVDVVYTVQCAGCNVLHATGEDSEVDTG